ncbi:SIR2 family NAD-dependent protein deacylase [Lewinella cohaerens]|uniref:SIR2 family NAD-dependent protein deacylase n=1 Tax=Lewinella cohaerens TaxID=70995 RepID=UPI0003663A95|nr:NAD-dependent deacylase [Lewinella cohaerens]
MRKREKIVVLTGAGISAESGINTFRDADGLWEGHDVMEVATPEGWRKNKELVLDFYNQRRRQLKTVSPNAGHLALKELEAQYDVVIVTQNVDNLHEQAGSTNIIHLHGELRKVRSTGDETLIYDWEEDCVLGDRCKKGYQLRPHIVWFGEAVPALEDAVDEIYGAHHILIVGTSMQVYPAAGLVGYAPRDANIYYIDPRPSINYELQQRSNLEVIAEPATTGVRKLVDRLLL